MELDINAYWPSFIVYEGPGALDPQNLLPDMTRSPERCLTSDNRDILRRLPSLCGLIGY
jgi:hypothetical protein